MLGSLLLASLCSLTAPGWTGRPYSPRLRGAPLSVPPKLRSPLTLGAAHTPDEPEGPPPPSFAELFKFTLFAMPMYISPTLLSLIDTAAVGQVSSIQLAALGPACAICDGITGLMVFISVGTTNAVSTAYNAGDTRSAKRAVSVSLLLSCLIGILVSISLFVSIGPIITNFVQPAAIASEVGQAGSAASALSGSAELWASCTSYVKIRSLSMPLALMLLSAQASCLGTKDATSPLLATLLASAVNVVGDLVLVLGPLAMGIAGAAYATVGCQLVAALQLVRTLHTKGLVDLPALRSTPTLQEVRRFFAFGAFIFVLVSKQLVYNQGVLLATVLGTAAGAAHQCLYSLFRLCCTLGDVTSSTAQSFLPQYYVKDTNTGALAFDVNAARGTILRIVAMTAVVAACNTIITFSIPFLKPDVFSADLQVVSLMQKAAPAAVAGLLLHPSVVGMEGCLLATKDIKWLVVNYIIIGGLSVVATQMLLKISALRSMLNLNAIWLYLAAFQGIRFLAFGWRLLTSTINVRRKLKN